MVTRIPVILDCVVSGVLTPVFGVSNAFARQTDARNGLSTKNLSFWAGFGRLEHDPGARKSGAVHRDHGSKGRTRVGRWLAGSGTRVVRGLAERACERQAAALLPRMRDAWRDTISERPPTQWQRVEQLEGRIWVSGTRWMHAMCPSLRPKVSGPRILPLKLKIGQFCEPINCPLLLHFKTRTFSWGALVDLNCPLLLHIDYLDFLCSEIYDFLILFA